LSIPKERVGEGVHIGTAEEAAEQKLYPLPGRTLVVEVRKQTVRYGKENARIIHGHRGPMDSEVRGNIGDNAQLANICSARPYRNRDRSSDHGDPEKPEKPVYKTLAAEYGTHPKEEKESRGTRQDGVKSVECDQGDYTISQGIC
jgi:hypothetical protein